MVFLTASKRITSLIGSPLLRFGLAARMPFGGGTKFDKLQQPIDSIVQLSKQKDTPYLDMALLIPFSQKLLSLALYDESEKVLSQHFREKQAKENKSSNSMLDSILSFQRAPNDSFTTLEMSNLRLQAYDNVIRKSLLPHERWSSLQTWIGHLRILKWARAEFLISKYGPMVKEAMDAYPQLRASPQFKRNPNHNFLLQLARGRLVLPGSATKTSEDSPKTTDDDGERLNKRKTTIMLPTTETIIKAFDMKGWAKEKSSRRLQESTLPILQKMFSSNGYPTNQNVDSSSSSVDYQDSLKQLCTEDLLHCLSGGHVQSCGPLNAVCEEADLYQLWTKEYIQHLGEYLIETYCNSKGQSHTTIVDIGAGDGLLIRCLQEYMKKKINKINRSSRKNKTSLEMPTMVATDDGSWGIFAKAKVEKLDVTRALQKYGKSDGGSNDDVVVVLCSWMPQQVDWTAQFRDARVDEYILIGEADDGSCGHGWETWGDPFLAPQGSKDLQPAFKKDGYHRWDMDSLIRFQFSRFDCALSRSSKTVSFRRK